MRLTTKYILFFVPLMFVAERMTSQTLTGVDSEVWSVMYGNTYRLSANPGLPYPIVPYITAEATGPMMFELVDTPASVWVFSFLLPDSLTVYDYGQPIYCSYDDSSGYHLQSDTYWDASRSHIATADSSGKITIGVGMLFGLPYCPIGDGYIANIICLATRLADGLTLIDTSQLTISSGVTDQCWSGDDVLVNIANLAPGHNYTIEPQSGAIQPIVTGRERGGSIQFSFFDDTASMKITIDFLLPNFLEGDHGRIPISFSPVSAREASGLLWNPRYTHVISSDQDGKVSFDLGFTIEVPDTALPGEYYAIVIWSVGHIGSEYQLKKGPRKSYSILSESSALITVTTLPSVPKAIYLYPNFPNPFNSSTTIKYDLPVPGDVTLKIYDVLGRETATLVNGFQFGGEHSVQWDGASFPSGVYVYRLQVGSFSQTRKIILMR